MMDLDDRLSQHFRHEAADMIGAAGGSGRAPVGNLGAVKARARQRTRNRMIATSPAGLAVVGVAAATALAVVTGGPATKIETLGPDTEQGELGLPPDTGSPLTWVDHGTAPFEARDAVWTGETFVSFGYGISDAEAGVPTIAGLYRSDDGIAWDLVVEPSANDDFHNVGLWSDEAGTVLAWSEAPGVDNVSQVLLSVDHGRTFSNAGTFTLSKSGLGAVDDIAEIRGMAIRDGIVHAAVSHSASIDVGRLVLAAGRDDLIPGDTVGDINASYGIDSTGLTLCLDQGCADSEVIPFTEMELTDADRIALEAEAQGGWIEVVTLVAGQQPKVVASGIGQPISGLLLGPDDGPGSFALAFAANRPGPTGAELVGRSILIGSQDGVEWNEIELSTSAWEVTVDPTGALVRLAPSDDAPRLERSVDLGQTWELAAPAAGTLIDGPAGQMVMGTTESAGVTWPGYSVSSGGYRLTVTDELATLTDETEGTQLFSIDGNEENPWLIEREADGSGDGEQWTLTVIHPQTGEQLMVITEQDLSQLGAGGEGVTRVPMIGWSSDGRSWGWQTFGQAFGSDIEDDQLRGNVPPHFVVGGDRVLALVPPPYVVGLEPAQDSAVDEPQPERSELSGEPTDDSHLLTRVFVAETTGR